MITAVLITREDTEFSSFAESLCIDLLNPLHHLEQPGAAGDAVGFEGRGNCQAYSFFGPCRVSHHKVRGQRVVVAICQFDAGVERLQIDGCVDSTGVPVEKTVLIVQSSPLLPQKILSQP